MNQEDYIKQLEQTIETLNNKLEETSNELEITKKNKAGKLIPKWREDSIFIKKEHKRKAKVHTYGCEGVFDFIWVRKTAGADGWWEFGYFYDNRIGRLNGHDFDGVKEIVESLYKESVDWYGVDEAHLQVKDSIQ